MALFGVDSQDTHSTRLIGEIDMILGRTGLKLENVFAFAAVTGPGSFTGLRIGLSTVKGLARATGRPVVGVTTLEATALSAGITGEVLSFVNALRQEVYAQLFQVSEDGQPTPQGQPMVAPPDAVLSRFADKRSLVIAGDAIRVYHKNVEAFVSAKGYLLSEPQVLARANDRAGDPGGVWTIAPDSPFLAMHAARLAAARVSQVGTDSAARLEAVYVRQSDAELKLGESKLGG